MVRSLEEILLQAKQEVLPDLPEKPEEAAALLLVYAEECHRQAEAASGRENMDAQWVDERVAYSFRLASLARQFVIELVLGHSILPSER